MERIWELDIPLQTISDKTGISRSTIYAFLYNGTDLSSMRLAKICSLLGLSMDYVMGLKEEPEWQNVNSGGAEVAIGARCTYCGSKAESWYYSGEEKKQEPKKKKASHDRVRDLFNGKIYIVKKGDCLWNIAKNLYGSGAEYYRLVKLNNIQDPNHIEVGWKLYY